MKNHKMKPGPSGQTEHNMKELVIIGQGPAGISAALYAVRGGASVTVVAKDGGALAKADKIQNYYGFADGVSAKELVANGIEQAKNLGVKFVEAEVCGVEFGADGFEVKTTDRTIAAGALVIACGTARNVPPIRNIDKFEGRGVSYCAICDGFFFRGKKVAVIGSGPYAESEYGVLKNIIEDVTILTNGLAPQFSLPCDTRKIESFEGGEAVEEIVFADGTREKFDGIFIACGSAGAFELSKKLGLETDGNKIVTDEKRATNIPGIYAAGDCISGMQQIAKAVCDGMIAGTEALKFLKAE